MAYQIHKRRLKNGTETFRVVYQRYDDGVRTARHVSRSEWPEIGFFPGMTVEQAKALAKQINSQEHLKRIETQRNKVATKHKDESRIESAFLPALFVQEFEDRVLAKRLNRGDVPSKRHLIQWRAAQRVIRDIKMDASEWVDNREVLYGYFEKHQVSLDYTTKLLRILNLWGHFICKKTSKPFLPVTNPRGYIANRIADAYEEKIPGGLASEPISPEELHEAKLRGLREDHFNWLFIAIWFGLRGWEVDSLKKNPESFRVWTDKNDVLILSVYQSKLRGISKEKRWKHIPVLEKEQLIAIQLIKEGNFKRPLVKTITSRIKAGADTRGPRKGFVTLMHKVRNHDFAHVSSWLGHQTIDRTWKSYRDRNEVMYKVS